MVDEVIRVLFDKEMEGEAKIIKDIYNYEISKQGQCENCRKGIISLKNKTFQQNNSECILSSLCSNDDSIFIVMFV